MATTFKLRLCCLLVLIISLSPVPTLSEKCNPQDKKVLLQIKKDITNKNPTLLSSWNPTTACCNQTWEGVACDPETNRDLQLSLFTSGNPFQIPSTVGDLPCMSFLYFYYIPNLTGPIPLTIAKLANLRYLTISHTNVSGTIPDFWPKLIASLRSFTCINSLRRVSGVWLSQLENLTDLTVTNVQVKATGPFVMLGHMNKLKSLTISHANLTGSLPRYVHSNLTHIDFPGHQLKRSIPTSVTTLDSFEIIPSLKVHATPGGGSSLGYLFSGPEEGNDILSAKLLQENAFF